MQIGLYNKSVLEKVYFLEGKTSEVLLPFLEKILQQFPIETIIYTNGPGSYMATKIAYVLLKTIQIVKEIEIKAIDAFTLNNNKPIKALGKLYFVKEKENIITKRFDKAIEQTFFMPKDLSKIKISNKIEPQYFIGAV